MRPAFEFISFCAARPATCRLTFTRVVNPDAEFSFLTDSAAEGAPAESPGGQSFIAPSCACLDEGLEPCTAEDILEDWKGIKDSFLAADGLCSAEDALKPLWATTDWKSKLPDSSVYIAYAGMGRFHCQLPGYRNPSAEDLFTFTQFHSLAELNDFCQNGLSYWKDPANPLVCKWTVR